MKRNYFFAAVAGLLLASCSQNEIMEVSPDAHPAVGFDVYAGVQNRGTITNNDATGTGIKAKGFGILAYYTGQDAWTAKIANLHPNFMWNQQVTWNSSAWTYAPVKYWPNTYLDKLSFFAYAPYSATQTGTVAQTNGIVVSAKDATAKPTIAFSLQATPAAMVDLVATYRKDVEKQTTAVAFNFAHILSRANFKAKVEQALNGTPTYIFVTGMRILGTATAGTNGNASGANTASLFYDKATYDWSAGTWDYTLTRNIPSVAYEVGGTGGILDKKPQTGTINSSYTTQGILVNQTAGTETDLFTSGQYLFLVPPRDITGITSEKDVRVQIDYDIVTNDINVKDGFSKTSTSATVSLPNTTLKRGSAYDFIFTIGLETVKVSASVTEWATVNTPLPSVDATAPTAAAIGTAVTAMNTTKTANPACNYFIINIAAAYTSGTLTLSGTTTAFKPGDKIELNFKAASTVSSVSLSGWTASGALGNATGKIILTKN